MVCTWLPTWPNCTSGSTRSTAKLWRHGSRQKALASRANRDKSASEFNILNKMTVGEKKKKRKEKNYTDYHREIINKHLKKRMTG